jgi:hypothetical protein
VFNMIEDLFAPGRKHTDEERKRLELTRVDLNDGDPGRGPIDLASGKVTVRAPAQPAGERDDRDGRPDQDGPGAPGQDGHETPERNGTGTSGQDGPGTPG